MEEIPGSQGLDIKKRSFGLLLRSMKHELARCDAGGAAEKKKSQPSLLASLLWPPHYHSVLKLNLQLI